MRIVQALSKHEILKDYFPIGFLCELNYFVRIRTNPTVLNLTSSVALHMMTLKKTVLAIFVVCAFRYCRSFELSLRGWDYISYDLRSRPIHSERNDISFSFKTFHPSGLVLHSGGSMGHFITIEIIQGKLR